MPKRGRRVVPKSRDSEGLQQLLARLNIHDWDYLIVGDGSGSTWDREVGWASVLIERETMERSVWWGTMNRATVNIAEMMAYLQPLGWLVAQEENRRTKEKNRGKACPTRAYKVHIITDSDYCRSTGKSVSRSGTKNAALWGVFDVFARSGFILNWHWLPREDCTLNRYCDAASKMVRKLGKKYNIRKRMADGDDPRTVEAANPSDPGGD